MKLRPVLLQGVAAVAGGLLLARWLYATDAGHAVLRLVPDRLWSALFGRLGLQGAETTSTVEIALVLLVCVIVAAAVVVLVARALGRRPTR